MKYHARFYGVPCVFDERGNEMYGASWWADLLLRFMAVPFACAVESLRCMVHGEYDAKFSIRLFKQIKENVDAQNKT